MTHIQNMYRAIVKQGEAIDADRGEIFGDAEVYIIAVDHEANTCTIKFTHSAENDEAIFTVFDDKAPNEMIAIGVDLDRLVIDLTLGQRIAVTKKEWDSLASTKGVKVRETNGVVWLEAFQYDLWEYSKILLLPSRINDIVNKWDGNTVEFILFVGAPEITQKPIPTPATPLHDKLQEFHEQIKGIQALLEYLSENGLWIAEGTSSAGTLSPAGMNSGNVLNVACKVYGIDYNELEKEKRAILQAIREQTARVMGTQADANTNDDAL